jgi:hypothetical protein
MANKRISSDETTYFLLELGDLFCYRVQTSFKDQSQTIVRTSKNIKENLPKAKNLNISVPVTISMSL